jgi:hypothetical protein
MIDAEKPSILLVNDSVRSDRERLECIYSEQLTRIRRATFASDSTRKKGQLYRMLHK